MGRFSCGKIGEEDAVWDEAALEVERELWGFGRLRFKESRFVARFEEFLCWRL